MTNLQKKINQSVTLLQKAEPKHSYNLAFSGGKDSVVIYHLAQIANVSFIPRYVNSGIDPPGHIDFIRYQYPNVIIIQPEKKFYQLVAEKGLPTRRSRYCCQYLRDFPGSGKTNILGIRQQESPRRKLYEPISCDTRPWMKGAINIMPILTWSNIEVWSFIIDNELPYSNYYDPPYSFERIGCVGCPLAGAKRQQEEFKLFPRYAFALTRAISRNMFNKPKNALNRYFYDEYHAFYWYISGKPVKSFLDDQGLYKAYSDRFYEEYYNKSISVHEKTQY